MPGCREIAATAPLLDPSYLCGECREHFERAAVGPARPRRRLRRRRAAGPGPGLLHRARPSRSRPASPGRPERRRRRRPLRPARRRPGRPRSARPSGLPIGFDRMARIAVARRPTTQSARAGSSSSPPSARRAGLSPLYSCYRLRMEGVRVETELRRTEPQEPDEALPTGSALPLHAHGRRPGARRRSTRAPARHATKEQTEIAFDGLVEAVRASATHEIRTC
ncbi:MAG: hypothetical protein MZV70_69010 [Desulfobacterales bacterium]|nr:hypothetical protein [Desulfobacterales bacterium]